VEWLVSAWGAAKWFGYHLLASVFGDSVTNNLIAWIVGVLLVTVVYNFGGSLIFGRSPKLRLSVGPSSDDTAVDWLHLTVENVGLPWSRGPDARWPLGRLTRAALGTIAHARFGTTELPLCWDGTTHPPATEIPVYRGRPRTTPVAVCDRRGIQPPKQHGQSLQYGWYMKPDRYYVADAGFLSQGSNQAWAQSLELSARTEFDVTVRSADGARATERFVFEPPSIPIGQGGKAKLTKLSA